MWPFKRKTRSEAKPTKPVNAHSDAGANEEIRHYVRLEIVAGFRPIHEIEGLVVELLCDRFDPARIGPLTRSVLAEEMERFEARQREWPDKTDCDRLDAAFSDLNENGILARQNAMCCQTCAGAEVWGEARSLMKDGVQIRGATFYHEQDTERAAEGGCIYLSYGAAEDDESASLAIAKEVRDVIRKHGLNVDWDGTFATRLAVDVDWKRRRSDVMVA